MSAPFKTTESDNRATLLTANGIAKNKNPEALEMAIPTTRDSPDLGSPRSIARHLHSSLDEAATQVLNPPETVRGVCSRSSRVKASTENGFLSARIHNSCCSEGASMKRGAVVHCTVISLSVAALLALPAVAQPAAKLKSSSQTVLGVPCSEIFERGIDKQENLRATLIRTECGLDAPGEAFEAGESGPILDLTNINL